jgi:prepilin-type N-terminal cleavage/methylation domain-containing protein
LISEVSDTLKHKNKELSVKIISSHQGFTLLETTIVLGLISILTFAVISGSSVGTNVERFNGQIRDFSASIRDAQTKSYTVQTGTCTAGTQVSLAGGQTGCVWRGNVLKFNVAGGASQPYSLSLLQGSDLGTYAGNSDPRFGLTYEYPYKTYDLNSMELFGIDKTTSGSTSSISSVEIAFLAPDGSGYVCPASCNVGGGATPFTDRSSKLAFHFRDVRNPNLMTNVLFDPANGSITTIQP